MTMAMVTFVTTMLIVTMIVLRMETCRCKCGSFKASLNSSVAILPVSQARFATYRGSFL